MQTFTQALIELVLAGDVDREVAANASTNRHDFLVELEQALKRKAAGVETDRPVSEMEPEVKPGEDADARAATRRPGRMRRLAAAAVLALVLAGSASADTFRVVAAPASNDVFRVIPDTVSSAPALFPSADTPNEPGLDLVSRLAAQLPAGSGDADVRAAARPLAAGRRGLRRALAGAGVDQQDRVELRPQHGPELRRRDRLDAVHALDLGALGDGRKRRRSRQSVEPRGRDPCRGALPRRLGWRVRRLARGLLLQPRPVVRGRGAAARAALRGGWG